MGVDGDDTDDAANDLPVDATRFPTRALPIRTRLSPTPSERPSWAASRTRSSSTPTASSSSPTGGLSGSGRPRGGHREVRVEPLVGSFSEAADNPVMRARPPRPRCRSRPARAGAAAGRRSRSRSRPTPRSRRSSSAASSTPRRPTGSVTASTTPPTTMRSSRSSGSTPRRPRHLGRGDRQAHPLRADAGRRLRLARRGAAGSSEADVARWRCDRRSPPTSAAMAPGNDAAARREANDRNGREHRRSTRGAEVDLIASDQDGSARSSSTASRSRARRRRRCRRAGSRSRTSDMSLPFELLEILVNPNVAFLLC